MEFVGQALLEELGVDRAAALDHQAVNSPYRVQVFKKQAPVEVGAEGDDVCGEAKPACPLRALVRRKDEFVAARVPEVGRRVQVARAGDRDLEGVFRLACGDSTRPALKGVDQEAGVVRADRADADEDRVHGRPDLIDTVEVGRAGEEQPVGAGVVEIAVEGDSGGQQDVRVGHRRALPARWVGLGSSLKQTYTGGMTTRWLTAEEQRAWRAYIAATHLLEDAIDRQLQQEAGMPHLYYSILANLSEVPDRRLRMTDLAEKSKITRSRLTYAVTRLEKDGLVRREGCPSDKRGSTAILTDEGMAVLERTAPGHVETVRAAIFDHLTPEQVRQMEEISAGIVRALEEPEDVPWRRRSTPSCS